MPKLWSQPSLFTFGWRASLLALGLLASWPAHALYRWVDDKGAVHFSDRLPSDPKNGSAVLNDKGQVLKLNPRQLSPEELQAKAEAEEKARKDKIAKDIQDRRDRALKSSYSDPKQIDEVLNRNLEQMAGYINATQTRREQASARIARLEEQKKRFLSRKKPVPQDLLDEIKEAQDEISKLDHGIELKRKEMEAEKAQAAQDKVRLQELLDEASKAKAAQK